MAVRELTHQYLTDNLNYDPETGTFTWKIPGKGRIMGKPLGSNHSNGYIELRFAGKLYLVHRLAWFHCTGSWPKYHIDHKDNDRTNNRISNLRDVTRTINNQNLGKAQSNSKTGTLGVRQCKDRFHANIGVNSKNIFLGSFPTLESAAEAYRLGKEKYHAGAMK